MEALEEPIIYTNIARAGRKPAPKVPDSVRTAAREYKKVYHALYGVNPEIRWDGTWFAVMGQSSRVKLKRLKELTTLLRHKLGESR